LENKYFTFVGLPLKIRDVDGAPIRAISFIENLK
jgi:kynurenine formamidase